MKTSHLIGTGFFLIALIGAVVGIQIWRTGKIHEKDTATATHLKEAIEGYFREYKRMPGTDGRQQGDAEFPSDLEFMSILTGAESESALSHLSDYESTNYGPRLKLVRWKGWPVRDLARQRDNLECCCPPKIGALRQRIYHLDPTGSL